MDSKIIARVVNVVQELKAIRAALGTPATDPSNGLAVAKLPTEAVQTLKVEVDQMRLFLWAYMETWAVGGTDSKHRLQRIRIEATAEMLRQLHTDFISEGVPGGVEAHRLSEEVQAVISLMPRDIKG